MEALLKTGKNVDSGKSCKIKGTKGCQDPIVEVQRVKANHAIGLAKEGDEIGDVVLQKSMKGVACTVIGNADAHPHFVRMIPAADLFAGSSRLNIEDNIVGWGRYGNSFFWGLLVCFGRLRLCRGRRWVFGVWGRMRWIDGELGNKVIPQA